MGRECGMRSPESFEFWILNFELFVFGSEKGKSIADFITQLPAHSITPSLHRFADYSARLKPDITAIEWIHLAAPPEAVSSPLRDGYGLAF